MRLLIIILFILLIPSVDAFGSIRTKTHTIWEGGSPVFTVLFYETENRTVPLIFDTILPTDWAADISPVVLNLEPNKGDMTIDTPSGDRLATPVTVTIHLPEHPTPGNYTITLRAQEQQHGEGIQFVQERLVPLEVEVKGTILPQDSTDGGGIVIVPVESNETRTESFWLYPLVAIVLVASLLKWKGYI